MKLFRAERVSRLIKEQVSLLLVRELEFHGALVTVTDVEVDKKLEHAKIKLSVLPAAKADGAMKIIERHAGEFQHLLLKKINIKPMPRIAFEIDRGYENAAQVEKSLMGK